MGHIIALDVESSSNYQNKDHSFNCSFLQIISKFCNILPLKTALSQKSHLFCKNCYKKGCNKMIYYAIHNHDLIFV